MNTVRSFPNWPVIGHDWAVDLLHRAVVVGRPPHTLLITGPPNVGKGTLARSLAQMLLCTADQPPCGCCRACRLATNYNHPDLRWVEPQGNSLKIDQVRQLTRQLALSPVEGPWQIAVLDQFELATAGAANALLKTLEDPPPGVILVLLAQQTDVLLPTIISRCQIIALRPLPRSVIEQALVEHWRVPFQKASLLSHLCCGRLGWAVSASTTPELLKNRAQKLDTLVKLLYSSRVPRFAYAESAARQSTEAILESLEIWTSWWRDILLLLSSSSTPLTNIDRQKELAQIAYSCDISIAQSALTALHVAADQLLRNANTRLSLEILLLALPFLQ